MQVSQVNDHVTHAVIGGKATIEFGISNSPEFFNILSSTLYKDQILAVVREVLCNAWDAHIEAGCTDKPVEITLTREKFIIKDSGKGIHLDDMGLIYGTYGNSTKKNDGKQTGGFGLGCKAPFAYTDHFEVISCNEGIKTIYNLSKSSAQAMGKPGIVPIASFPTTESGLQVSIAIHSNSDFTRFYNLVKRIVQNGDMNMVMNGTQLPKLGFNTSVSNYLITMGSDLLESDTEVMIRYGNVIYPVEQHSKYAEEFRAIKQQLASLREVRRSGYVIIFQAPPHSISVTPSRESLSMQDHTINTLHSLFTNFVSDIKNNFDSVCSTYVKASVDIAVANKATGVLLSRAAKLPSLRKDNEAIKNIQELEVMAQQYFRNNYPNIPSFNRDDFKYRVISMSKAGMLDRGLVQTYLKELKIINKGSKYDSQWLQRQIIAPLMVKLSNAGIDPKRLYTFDSNSPHNPNRYSTKTVQPLVVASKAHCVDIVPVVSYMRNIIVISGSTADIYEKVKLHPNFIGQGENNGYLFYQTSMKKVEREAAIAFFNKSGMLVIDLTVKAESASSTSTRNTSIVPRKPVKKGVPCITAALANNRIYIDYAYQESATRIIDPAYIVLAPSNKDVVKRRFNRLDESLSRLVVELFGSVGGITNNKTVYEKYITGGAKTLEAYVEAKVCEYMRTNPAIQSYWAFNIDALLEVNNMRSDKNEYIRTIYESKLLRKEFNLENNLTVENKKYMQLWEFFSNTRNGIASNDVFATYQHLKAIPFHPANQLLLDKVKNNTMLHIINRSGLMNILGEHLSDSIEIKKALNILHAVLNN